MSLDVIQPNDASMPAPAGIEPAPEPQAVVAAFIRDVRSGRHPELASRYMAPRVTAHQLCAEDRQTVERTPEEYAVHVREFLDLFGEFSLEIEEMISQDDRVFVRWRQDGRHVGSQDGEAPTGAPLTELTSVVYRVEQGRIVEYWLQFDRKGMEMQLESLAAAH